MKLGFSVFGVDITIVDTDMAPTDVPTGEERLDVAEEFIHENSALYRHNPIEVVQWDVEYHTGIQLSDEEAMQIVQDLRNEHGMGPIREEYLPGYISPDEEEDESPTVSTSHEDARPWWKIW